VNDADDFAVEVAAAPPGDDLAAAFALERARFSRPELPIDSPWLARARVVAGDGQVLICLVFHHMVFDARSRLLVEQELRARLAPGADPGAVRPRAQQYLDYAASKGAIDSMTLGLAKEVAAEGIRVNAVRPGLIETELHASGGLPNRVRDLAHQVPIQRGGSAEEVAQAIVWLLSEDASYTTMSFLDVSGGR
jgi:hypothetical protein